MSFSASSAAPVIRPASLSDIPAITRIYGQSVATATASFELEPPSEQEMANRMQGLLQTGFPYLAADLDGRLAGYAYAGFYRARPAYRFTVENSVYVDPGAQRRGVARALMTALVAACTQRGFRQMIAVIGDSPNQTASVAMHTAMGFTRVGILDNVGYKHGRWLDSLLMQLTLGDGGTTDPA
jgi:phosphinothricin acetyltransferase